MNLNREPHTSSRHAPLLLLAGIFVLLPGCPAPADGDEQNGSADATNSGTETGGTSSATADPDTGTGDDPDTDTEGDTLDSSGTDDGTDTEAETDTDGVARWSTYGHPCPGPNRTDALHRDDDGTLWVGCGSGATGYGLFYSADGGPSWAEAEVTPEGKLHQFRVSSISRGHDGALYIAGINANNGDMVLRLDTSESPFPAESVLVAGNQLGTSFHVGTYRERSDGSALAESLNGTDMLYRPDPSVGSDATTWTDTYGWFNGGGAQLLDLVVHDDQFYGAGSTIAEPPRVFLPPTTDTEPYNFVTVQMDHPKGELWGIAVDESRVVAVGMNQVDNVGRVYVSGSDPYDAGGYTAHSLHDLIGVDASVVTWARGVCMQDDRIAVVGERQPLSSNTGIVVLSTDGGETFTDVTPEDVPATVSKCLFRPDGALEAAGADGFVGIYD